MNFKSSFNKKVFHFPVENSYYEKYNDALMRVNKLKTKYPNDNFVIKPITFIAKIVCILKKN
jgi:hypothetical protein